MLWQPTGLIIVCAALDTPRIQQWRETGKEVMVFPLWEAGRGDNDLDLPSHPVGQRGKNQLFGQFRAPRSSSAL